MDTLSAPVTSDECAGALESDDFCLSVLWSSAQTSAELQVDSCWAVVSGWLLSEIMIY